MIPITVSVDELKLIEDVLVGHSRACRTIAGLMMISKGDPFDDKADEIDKLLNNLRRQFP